MLETVVHIVFDTDNDPQRVASRHVGRQVGRGMAQSDIVRAAWQDRHKPFGTAVTSTSFRAPPFNAVEIYYDPAAVDGATEQEVMGALIKAGQR